MGTRKAYAPGSPGRLILKTKAKELREAYDTWRASEGMKHEMTQGVFRKRGPLRSALKQSWERLMRERAESEHFRRKHA